MDLYPTVIHDLERFSVLPHLAGQRVLAAVSGGADSLCLLHLLHRLQPALGLTLAVATLDHGLRGEKSAADAAYVEQIGREWGLPVWRARIDVPALIDLHHLGVEEAARRARYTFLAGAAHEFGAAVIATGHHADDQAETILMHLIRGTGLAGLRGMQAVTPLSAQHLLPGGPPPAGLTLVRPLLGVSRADIEAYCAAHDLRPRIDSTNTDPALLRNRVRQELLPLLETYNPAIRQVLSRTGQLLSDDYTKLESLTRAALARLRHDQSPGFVALDQSAFRVLEPGLQRAVLRRVVQTLLGPAHDLGFTTLEAACRIASAGTTGQQATLPGGIVLRVAHDSLQFTHPHAAPKAPPDWPLLPPGTQLPVSIPGGTALPGGNWRLHTCWLAADEDPAAFYGRPFTAVLALPPGAILALRTRRPGDRLAPLGMGGSTQKIKDILIALRIPADVRDHLPLLTVNDRPAWLVAGEQQRLAEDFAVRVTSHQRVLLLYYTQDVNPISALPQHD